MSFIDFTSIVKEAWQAYDNTREIVRIVDISAKVSTNYVFRVTFITKSYPENIIGRNLCAYINNANNFPGIIVGLPCFFNNRSKIYKRHNVLHKAVKMRLFYIIKSSVATL